MCFSTTASFASATLLSVVGVASIKKVTKSPQYAFASIPFIFAVQQFSEGFVWLSLTNPSFATWDTVPIYVFLTFAFVLWPVSIPLSVLLLEKNEKKKTQLEIILGLGVLLALHFTYSMVVNAVSAKVDSHHIVYAFNNPNTINSLTVVTYGFSAIVPLFISSLKKMQWLGGLLIVSYILTAIFYKGYVTSVWCFFAALISVIILWILYDTQKSDLTKKNISFVEKQSTINTFYSNT